MPSRTYSGKPSKSLQMSESIIELDRAATLAINGLNSPVSDQFWALVSDTSLWFPAYAAVAVFIFWRLGWKRALIVIASLALTIVACDQITNLVKHSVGRLRPIYDAQMMERGIHWIQSRGGGLYGFFSAHAANAFGFVTCSLIGLRSDGIHKYKGYAAAGFIWAALVSISRIMLAKHFLGDILVGALAGILVGFLLGKAAAWITGRAGLSPS